MSSRDRLLDRRDRVGPEAALLEADAVHDHVRAGSDAADRAAVDAEEIAAGDPVACGRGRRVRAVTLGVSRRAMLVMSLQYSPESALMTDMYVSMNAYAPISLLLHANVGPRWATSPPSPNWQPYGRRGRRAGPCRRTSGARARRPCRDADGDVLPALDRAAERRPHVRRTDERRRRVLRLLELVRLNGHDAVDLEQAATLLAGTVPARRRRPSLNLLWTFTPGTAFLTAAVISRRALRVFW